MSIALVRFGWTLLLTTPSAVELSVWIGVGGCLWPISLRMARMYTASRAMMYKAPSLALAADDITFLMIWAMLRTAPLFCGIAALFDRKKCPPTLLLACGLFRYPASL